MQTFPCPENFLKRLNNSHSSGGVTWGERGKGGGCGCNRSAFCKIVSFWEKVFPFMNLYTVHLASLSLLLLSRVFLDPFAATWVMFKDHILLIDRVKRNRPLLWPPHTVINLNDIRWFLSLSQGIIRQWLQHHWCPVIAFCLLKVLIRV